MGQNPSSARSDLDDIIVDEAAKPMALPLSLLKEITGGFSKDRVIGSGGFAVVYKGIVSGRAIAVKRFSNAFKDEKIFGQEVECLMRVKHKNAVRFLGYCADRQENAQSHEGRIVMVHDQERLLCFEYISNGSLRKYITDNNREWATCYKIIKGICEGIQHLHDKNIVHLDLKPDNILLDNNMSPKISDFGLSRCFNKNQSHDTTENIIGTRGYTAPELLEGGTIRRSNDFYSLGVVIIEILTGQRCNQATEEVLKSWRDRQERSQRDAVCKQIQVCYQVALECTDNNPKKRPDSAKTIIDRLQRTENIQLLYDKKGLRVEGYTGTLADCNMDRVELMEISDVSHTPLLDLKRLNSLRSIHFKRCNNTVFAEVNGAVVLHSVANLHIEELQITGELFSNVLRCFPAISELSITKCERLELLPKEDGGLGDLTRLQSFKASSCKKLFSRWPMDEVGGGAHAVKPFPDSLIELDISFESSMQSMGLLSNLTSLTSLSLRFCFELTMHGFNPHITVNLRKLAIDAIYADQKKLFYKKGDLLPELARSKLMYAGSFQLEVLNVDSFSAVLRDPICSHLATTLHTLIFSNAEGIIFTEEQERALHLLSSLRHLGFQSCYSLKSLPQGLHRLLSLKKLVINSCLEIQSLPSKEGLPTSLETLEVFLCSRKATKQAEKLKAADPWFSVKVDGTYITRHKSIGNALFLRPDRLHVSIAGLDAVSSAIVYGVAWIADLW